MDDTPRDGVADRISLLDRIPVVRDMDSTKRKGALGSASVHFLALAFALGWFSTTPPPLPGTPTNLTVFDIGIPSNGSPTGDDAPAPQAEDVQAEASQPEIENDPEEETERVDPDSGEETDVSTTPIVDDEESEIQPESAAPAQEQEGAEQREDSSTPQTTTVQMPSDRTGTGSMAVGATTHGDATGLDPTLSAVIGQTVATRMGACWKRPTQGVPPDAYSRMVVRYDPNGEFLGVFSVIRLIDQQEVEVDSLNEYEQSAADALRRCSPLGLPSSLYAYWMEVEIQLFGAPPPPLTTER